MPASYPYGLGFLFYLFENKKIGHLCGVSKVGPFMLLGSLLDLSEDKEISHLCEILKVSSFAFLGPLLNLFEDNLCKVLKVGPYAFLWGFCSTCLRIRRLAIHMRS